MPINTGKRPGPAAGAALEARFGLLYAGTTVATVKLPTQPLAEFTFAGGIRPKIATIDFDLGVTYSPAKAVDIYGSVQNLTNAQYLATGYSLTSFEGSTVNATAIPTLGMPLTAIAGLRVKF